MAPTAPIPQEPAPAVRPVPTATDEDATVIDFLASRRRHAERDRPEVARSMRAHPAMGGAARYA